MERWIIFERQEVHDSAFIHFRFWQGENNKNDKTRGYEQKDPDPDAEEVLVTVDIPNSSSHVV